MPKKPYLLYLQGKGTGTLHRREVKALHQIERRGIEVIHYPVDWLSGESFGSILDKLEARAYRKVRQVGDITISGASAGGALAFNLRARLMERDPGLTVRAINNCGRLSEGDLKPFDYRRLSIMARNSESFSDSVIYCETVTIPGLSDEDKKNMRVLLPIADEVVPRTTMQVDGIETINLPTALHALNTIYGLCRTPIIVNSFFQEAA